MQKDGYIPDLPGYVSVKEASKLLGLSIRRIHELVQNGRIRAHKASHVVMLLEEDVRNFESQPTGRPRTRVPIWRLPVGKNIQYLTIIFARIKDGQGERFDAKLEEIRAGEKHLLPGTVARYIARSEEKPEDVQIVLVWRSTVMPPAGEREAALAALRAEFAEILDWENAWSEYGRVVMHT
jgi:excisionase family DNA binding protein